MTAARKGNDTATLVPYLPRLAIEWAGSDPSTILRVVDGSLVFADVSGFTALSERLARKGRQGAEELTETLSRCFGDLLRVAYDAGGSLIKFGGDALLLLFDGDDHASRACASALGMRSTMAETGRVHTTVGDVRLRMSVGVHSGEVHLFRVGRSHRELVITGPAASAVVDMEGTAAAGEIVVSSATAAQVPSAFVGAPKGPGFLLRSVNVDVPAVPTPAPSASAGVAEAVPVALRDHLLDGAAESEHRHVSIAFVHFDNVDAVVAEQGPEALAAALDALVGDVQDAADEHGVTFLASDVDHDGGKLILVTGAPRAIDDGEGRMLRCLRRIADGPRLLPVRIGVNHGHVFVGAVGPPFRRTYTVMGDAVNLAARVMAKAAPGQVLATAAVVDGAATTFDAAPLEPFMVKGKREPVRAFAVGAAGARRAETAALPLEGREAELLALSAALERAQGPRQPRRPHGGGGHRQVPPRPRTGGACRWRHRRPRLLRTV